MASSKASFSLILLFAFLQTSHVLPHELYGEERIPAHNVDVHELEGLTIGSLGYYPNDFKWISPSIGSSAAATPPPPPPRRYYPNDFKWISPSIGSSAGATPPPPPPPPAYMIFLDGYDHIGFPQTFLSMLPAKRDHHAYSASYQPNDFQWTVPLVLKAKEDYFVPYLESKNYAEGSVMKHRKMMRPSKIDWRSLHVFPTKTSSIADSGKKSYEDVAEETIN